MRKISVIIALFTLLFAVGCEEDEYTAPDTISDVSWYTGIYPGQPYAVNVGEYISFMDVSQGALSHEWTIEEGNNYLNPDFSEGDSLPLFIKENVPLTTDETTIHVLFNNVGKNKVRLYNTFEDSVSYNGTTPYGAKRQGDVWVIDTTMVVDVFDVINPAVDVYQDGELVKSISEEDNPLNEDRPTWDTVYVEAGATLTYVDMTTVGRPTDRKWLLTGARFVDGNETDSAVTVNYFGLGNYTGSVTVSRSGNGLPDAKTSKKIPLIVKVIQSTQPFIAVEGSFSEDAEETISFSVSGELSPFAEEEENFTVHVENETTGFSEDIPVTLATVNSEDATRIDLTLSEPIYNTDVVTVSFSGGNIQSVDERALEPFVDQQVEMYLTPNLLNSDWAGFETYASNYKKAYCDGFWVGPKNGTADNPYFSRVDGNLSPTGKPVMSYTSAGGVIDLTLQGADFDGMLSEAGTYLISFRLYIEPGSNLSTIKTSVQEPWTNLVWDVSDVTEGKWVELKRIETFSNVPSKKYNLSMSSSENPGAGDVKFYVDDHSFILLEERP